MVKEDYKENIWSVREKGKVEERNMVGLSKKGRRRKTMEEETEENICGRKLELWEKKGNEEISWEMKYLVCKKEEKLVFFSVQEKENKNRKGEKYLEKENCCFVIGEEGNKQIFSRGKMSPMQDDI